MQVFISYATEQKETAERVCTFLEAGGKKCWIAPRNILPGSNYGEEIIKGIEGSDLFVVLFDAAANESQHVLREVERAVSKRLPIVVYRLDNTVPSKSMEYFLRSIQWLDARVISERSLEALEDALERQMGASSEFKGQPGQATDELTGSADGETVSGISMSEAGINPHQKISKKKWLGVLLGVVSVLAIMVVLGAVQKFRNEEKDPASTKVAEQSGTEDEKDVTPAGAADEEATVAFQVGDYVSFGYYVPGGEPAENGEGTIEWQVVDVGEEGTLLVSTRILAIRPFDCAESGRCYWDNNGEMYDWGKSDTYTEAQMREFRGSNDWETSDLRTWLNANGVVQYPGKVPQNAATDEYGNAYGAEAGFLTDFTKAEAAMVAQSGNGVFLLTKEQVSEYAEKGTLQLVTTPTEAAIAADETPWYRRYKNSGATDYIWATASAVEGSADEIYHVDISGAKETFGKLLAAASGHGIRPAICIFPAEGRWEGDGSRQDPYRLEK